MRSPLVAIAVAAAIALALLGIVAVIGSRPGGGEGGVAPAAGDLAILERRLAAVEARLDAIGPPGTASPETADREGPPDGAEPGEGGDEEGVPGGGRLDRLEARVARLEVRAEAGDDDPIHRGQAYLASESAEVRREGIRLLGQFARSDPAVREALWSALADPDPKVRCEAVEALGESDDPASAERILALVSDPDGSVRARAIAAAAELLGEAKSDDSRAREAAAAIAERLGDPEVSVRRRAAWALGKLKAPGAGPALARLLGEPDEEVREATIESLGRIADPSTAPALKGIYRQGAGPEALRIAAVLKKLGDGEPFRDEVARLVTQASSESDDVRLKAIRGLARHAREESREVFLRALEDPVPRVRKEAREALGIEDGEEEEREEEE